MPEVGELALARAVTHQALVDAVAKPSSQRRTHVEIRDARLFLTADEGAWSRARENWCALADVSSDQVRAQAIELIARHETSQLLKAS